MSDDDADYTFIISSERNKQPRATVRINDTDIHSLIDTGASVNVMGAKTFRQIKARPQLYTSTNVRIYPYNSDEALPVLGTFDTTVAFKEHAIDTTFHVIDGDCDTLLSFHTASDLHMIAITYAIPTGTTDITDTYADRFQGIGKLEGVTCTLHVDPNVTCQSRISIDVFRFM